jgi:hypothetical protein
MAKNTETDKAETKPTGRRLSIDYRPFKEIGQTITGLFINRVEIVSKQNGGKYNQYVFDTDEGKIKFHCGAFFDHDAGSLMQIGGRYRIEYLGKKDVGGGNRVNVFELYDVGDGRQ